MPEPQPLVCVFFKLPPSDRPVLRLHEIAWDVFLSQLDCLTRAFEVAKATHPSSDATKIWSEARRGATERIYQLQRAVYMNHRTAFDFLAFLEDLHKGRDASKAYKSFQGNARQAVKEANIAQEEILNFREDIRIAIGRITSIMSEGDKDVSSLMTESSQSLVELATGVEECNALLEEQRHEFTEVQEQSFDQKNNPPSEEEFQMVREKWLAFQEIADPLKYGWLALRTQMSGSEDNGEPPTTSPNNVTSSTRLPDSSKHSKIPWWRNFLRRMLSCL